MKLSALFSVFVLFLVIERAYPTTRCNLYNLGMKGAYPCALDWWTAKDYSKAITFSPNATEIIGNALTGFGVNLADVERSLGNAGLPDTTNTNVLSKIIESALVVFPYLMYVVADGINGFDMTENELAKLNLPSVLADRENLEILYSKYFVTACKEDPVRPFLNCMNNWLKNNCDADEDDPETISKLVAGLKGEYCTDQGTLKSDIRKSLSDSLGTIWTPVAKQFGVFKDPNSPYVFNVKMDSSILDPAKLQKLTESMNSKCFPDIQKLMESVIDVRSPGSSSVGAGDAVNRFVEAGLKLQTCSQDVMKEVGVFNGDFSKPTDHLAQLYPDVLLLQPDNSAGISAVSTAFLFATLLTSMFM